MKKQMKIQSDANTQSDTKVDGGIHVLKTATCTNLAGKAKLVYQVGRSPEGRLQVRVIKNSSSGCFSDEWFDLDTLWKELAKNSPGDGPVTSADSMKIFLNRSQNTCGFVFATLKAEGLVSTSRQKRRAYDRVDAATYDAKCRALLEGRTGKADKSNRVRRSPAGPATTRRTDKAPRKHKTT